jgi:hypothetical protein
MATTTTAPFCLSTASLQIAVATPEKQQQQHQLHIQLPAIKTTL